MRKFVKNGDVYWKFDGAVAGDETFGGMPEAETRAQLKYLRDCLKHLKFLALDSQRKYKAALNRVYGERLMTSSTYDREREKLKKAKKDRNRQEEKARQLQNYLRKFEKDVRGRTSGKRST